MRYFRFSLKFLLIATTLIAAYVYWLMPIPLEIYSDKMIPNAAGVRENVGERIDILGRNKTESFALLYRSIRVVRVEPSTNPRLGRIRIIVSTNLWRKRTLDKFEILRVRNSDPDSP